jgi:hypothetical protein
MNLHSILWLPPATAVTFLAIFAALLWSRQTSSTKDRDTPTDSHSERAYKDFEFFVTVSLAIVAGMGYLRFEKYDNARLVGEQAMHGLGLLGLVVATAMSLFIIIHQGSKLRRWANIEWRMLPYWLELWMCITIMLVGSGIWIASRLW